MLCTNQDCLILRRKIILLQKKETLAMGYALQKLGHYLLGNKLTSLMDHMALVYLVNKSLVFRMLVKWLLLFLEYDFKIIYKPGRSHLMANALSKLPNHIELVGIPNQTYDVHMFTLQLEWL
jgi:hypothetical protein